MIQNTANKPLSELFSSENKVTYHIPKYQRPYVWSKWDWENLFDDILESGGGHFLGSIICINTQKDSHKAAELELVDGQQRMTTISLLYLAIYAFLKDHSPEPQELDYELDLRRLLNRIYLDKEKSVRLSPAISGNNLEDYEFIFSNEIELIKPKKKRPKNHGNRRISKTFEYFISRLYETDEDEVNIYGVDEVKDFLEKLNSATIVKIDVASHADAFTLFETLNNRGVPLSAIDLIKNKLLGHLQRVDEKSTIEENFDRWMVIMDNLTDEYKVQERFLRQFYNAFKSNPRIAVEKRPKAIRSNLIWIYDELIERDVHYFFDELQIASELYSKNIQYNNDENSLELIRALRNLENVNGADGYMLLLFIDKTFEISETDKVDLINLLSNYFIRRNVTDMPPTRDLTNHFIEIIEKIDELEEYSFEDVKTIILEYGRPASNELFEQKLMGDIYEENVGAARYILSSIEYHFSATKERFTNFYAREKKKFVWTIEHIFPQGDNIPQDWIDMVADGDKMEAKRIKNEQVHKLGNLTLTGYNSQLSNMSLEKKQNRKSKDGKSIGFKNGLYLNEELKDIETWGESQIINRTKKLVDLALHIFKL